MDHRRHLLREELDAGNRQLSDYTSIFSDWQWEMDKDLHFTWFSECFETVTGVSIADCVGTSWQTFVGNAGEAQKWQIQNELLRARKPFRSFELPIYISDDNVHWAAISGIPIFSDNRSFKGYRGVGTDITRVKKIELTAAQSHNHFIRAIDRYPGAFGLVDQHLNIVSCNFRFSQMYAKYGAILREGEPVRNALEILANNKHFAEAKGRELEWVEERLHAYQNPTDPYETERDGFWYRVEFHHLPDKSCLITMTDITGYKNIEIELKNSERRFRDVAETAADWFWETNAQQRISYISDRFLAIKGLAAKQIIGKHCKYVTLPYIADTDQRTELEQSLENGTPFAGICLEVPVNKGEARYFHASGKPVIDESGELLGFRGSCHDITGARELEKKLIHQTRHDDLTGLPNRSEFERRLSEVVSNPANLTQNWFVGYLDLDRFKIVNDTVGHGAGDQLLSQISTILSGVLDDHDLLARLGGDEFGLLLRRSSIEEVMSLTDKIFKRLDDYVFEWGSRIFSVNASIGLVQITEDQCAEQELLSCADIACYTAKDLGRGQAHLFQATDTEQVKRRNEVLVAAGIKTAIEDDRFILYAQPIANIGEGSLQLSHYEILVRMLDQDGNLIPPGSFIPAAERFGLMDKVDRWVLENSLSAMGHVLADNDDVAITINLSGQSLSDKSLARFVQETLATFNVQPYRVAFELTETAAISNIEQADNFIRSMKAIGCQFALDDFGSGLSSFSYIKHFPVDYVKIDGSFVKDILTDPTDRVMVSAINQMAHLLGMKTIAEFVENDEILDELITIGVDYVQGYGIGRPVPFAPGLDAALGTSEGNKIKAA